MSTGAFDPASYPALSLDQQAAAVGSRTELARALACGAATRTLLAENSWVSYPLAREDGGRWTLACFAAQALDRDGQTLVYEPEVLVLLRWDDLEPAGAWRLRGPVRPPSEGPLGTVLPAAARALDPELLGDLEAARAEAADAVFTALAGDAAPPAAAVRTLDACLRLLVAAELRPAYEEAAPGMLDRLGELAGRGPWAPSTEVPEVPRRPLGSAAGDDPFA